MVGAAAHGVPSGEIRGAIISGRGGQNQRCSDHGRKKDTHAVQVYITWHGPSACALRYLPALKRFSASCQLTTFHHAAR